MREGAACHASARQSEAITHSYTEKTDAKIKIPTTHSNRVQEIASNPSGPWGSDTSTYCIVYYSL